MIKIKNITKKWKNFALSNINLEVEKGEYFVVLGPTGAGKTLLLELIAGFHYPDKGKIFINGKDVTYLPPSQREIGFVYQDYMLFPHMNVKDNIAFGLRMKGLKEEEIEERINLLAETCKIKGILKKGELLTPPKIGVLASLGIEKVKVYEKPKVKIFPTGKEIVKLGEELDYGKIYDINSYTLATLLINEGAKPIINDIVEDDEEAIEEAIGRAIDADYIIFSGGSSIGERDLLAKVIKKKGELLFHGIAVKPGKPTICGKIDNTLIFGMPGYPTSCLTNAYVLLLPSIKKMARLPFEIKKVKAKLAQNILSTIGRYQIYPVKVENGIAYPVFKESGAITSLSKANGYIEIPAEVEYLEEGMEVIVTLF